MNAIDAMRTVSDRMKELGVLTEQHDSNPILVRVLDSGVGIDSDDMSRLFEAFYTTKPKGIGMGLTISRSIIEAHGGRLWAERNDGPGSTFCFTLPIGKESEALTQKRQLFLPWMTTPQCNVLFHPVSGLLR